jgi:hypothetical protein
MNLSTSTRLPSIHPPALSLMTAIGNFDALARWACESGSHHRAGSEGLGYSRPHTCR